MAGIHLLDHAIGSEYPSLATDADVRAFEQIPYLDRIAATSTYDAIRLGASHNPMHPRSSSCPMPTRPTRRWSSPTATSSRA